MYNFNIYIYIHVTHPDVWVLEATLTYFLVYIDPFFGVGEEGKFPVEGFTG